MATKKTTIRPPHGTVDDLDLDQLQFPGESHADRQKKKARKPILRVSTGYAQGARDQFTNPSFIKHTVSKALPSGYDTAIDLGDTAVRGTRELYHNAVREMQPAIPVLRRATKAFLPKTGKILPKSLVKRLDKFANKEDATSAQTNFDEETIRSAVGEVFATQAEETARFRAEDLAREDLREGVNELRQRRSIKELTAIRHGMDRLVSYQDQVLAKYQQKSMELQYRQYFTLRDMLKLQIDDSTRNREYMEAIVKNTALPEAVKISNTERYGDTLRNRVMGRSQDAVASYINQFASNVFKNLQGQLNSVIGGFNSAMTSVDGMLDASEMAKEMGVEMDPFEGAGQFAGSMSAGYVGKKAAKALRGKLSKNATMRRGGAKAENLVNNLPGMLNRWAGTYSDGKMAGLKDFIKSLMPRLSLDNRLSGSPLLSEDQAATFDNQTRRSITEVIPGYLSRILQEITILRTGDETTGRVVYNPTRGQFTSKKAAEGDMRERVLGGYRGELTKRGIGDLVDHLDPEQKLSDDTRRRLAKQLMTDSASRPDFDLSRYTSDQSDAGELTPEDRTAIDRVVGARHRDARGRINPETLRDTIREYRNFRYSASDPREIVKALQERGYGELLEPMGIIKRQGSGTVLDYSKVFDEILGEDKIGGRGARVKAEEPEVTGPDGKPGVWKRAKAWAKGGADELSKKAQQAFAVAKDLYHEGSTVPLVKAQALKAGEYISLKTGEAIHSMEELADGIKNEEGEIVLRPGEVFEGLMTKDGMPLFDYKEKARAFKASVGSHIDKGKEYVDRELKEGADKANKAWDAYGAQRLDASKRSASEMRDKIKDRAETIKTSASERSQKARERVSPVIEKGRSYVKIKTDPNTPFISQTPGEMGEEASAETSYQPSALSVLLESFKEQSQAQLDEVIDILENRDFTNGLGVSGEVRISPKHGLLRRGASRTWRGAKRSARLFGSYAKGVYKGAFGVIKAPFKMAGGLINGLLGPRITDIRVKGEKKPRLYARKIKDGEYRDSNSGKLISTIKDIQKAIKGGGEIINREGNVVLNAEDAAKGLVDNRGSTILGSLSKAAGGLLSAMTGYVGAAVPLPFKVLGAAARGAGKLLDGMFSKPKPADVYVKGEMEKPRLRAVGMRKGEYLCKTTEKVVKTPADIKGPVYDKDGNLLLSEEDLKKGIVDYRGKKFRYSSMLSGLGQGIGGVIGGVGSFAGKAIGGYFKMVGSLFGAGARGVAGIFKRIGRKFLPKKGDSKEVFLQAESLSLLDGIYRLLDERLPKPEKIRKGSWKDQARHEKEELAPDTETTENHRGGGILGFLSGLFGHGKDEDDEDEGGNGNTFIDASGRRRKKGTFGRNTKARFKRMGRKLGRSRVGRGLGKAGRFLGRTRLGRGIGTAARFVGRSRAGALAARGLGGVGRMALGLGRGVMGLGRLALLGDVVGGGGALASGLATVGGGIATAASAVGSGLAAAGSAVAGALSAPVVLGAAAVAAVGAGIYYGVKYYNLKKSRPLRKFRMAQYGVDLNDSVWPMAKVEKLEDYLKDKVTLPSGEGDSKDDAKASFNKDAFKDMDKIYKMFGIKKSWYNPLGWFHSEDDKDKAHQQALVDWINHRFKPVYLTWLTTLKGVDPKVKLDDIYDLKPKQKLELLEKTHSAVDSSIYHLAASPFGDDKISTDPKVVEAAYAEAKTKYEKEVEKDKKSGKDKKGKASVVPAGTAKKGAAAGAALAAGKKAADASKTAKSKADVAAQKQANAEAKTKANAAAKALGVSALTLKSSPIPKGSILGSKVSALQAIRYKAYGLSDFHYDKVKALFLLESATIRQFKYDPNGDASYKGDPEDAFKTFCGGFGVSPSDKVKKLNWITWFKTRFLPVALQFASAVKHVKASVDPLDATERLDTGDLVTVANAVITTTTTPEDAKEPVSVWRLTKPSPWDENELEGDSTSTDGNLALLKEAAKKRVLTQETLSLTKANDKLKEDMKSPTRATSPSTAPKPQRPRPINLSPATASQSAQPYQAKVDVPVSAIGQTIRQPGNGTGGDINDIPMPTGGAGWSSVENTIIAAARMAGVDPSLMATFANIESAFNPSAKAPTSSAAGLYQFINSTWHSMLKKYGKKYGINPKTSQYDPRANALMGAEFLKQNARVLKSALKREPTDTEMYLAHFLGAGGAKHLLTAGGTAIASALNPAAARANASIFYHNGTPRTVSQLVRYMSNLVSKKRKPVSRDEVRTVLAAMPSGEGTKHVEMAYADEAGPKTPIAGGSTTTTANGPEGGQTPYTPPSDIAENDAPASAGDRRSKPLTSLTAPSVDRTLMVSTAGTPSGRIPEVTPEETNTYRKKKAETNDYVAKQTNEHLHRNVMTMTDHLSRQLQVQTDMKDLLTRQVALLSGIHKHTQDTSEGIANADKSDKTANGKLPSNLKPRSDRPYTAGVSSQAVSLRRSDLRLANNGS